MMKNDVQIHASINANIQTQIIIITLRSNTDGDDDQEGPKCAFPTYIPSRWQIYQLMNSKVFSGIDSTLTVEIKPLLTFHRATCGNEG